MCVSTTKTITHGYPNHWHDSFSYVATMFNILMAKNNLLLATYFLETGYKCLLPVPIKHGRVVTGCCNTCLTHTSVN